MYPHLFVSNSALYTPGATELRRDLVNLQVAYFIVCVLGSI